MHTRDQWLAESERQYKNFSPEQIIRAAEAVAKSIQPNSIQISHSSEGFEARQPYLYYLIFSASSGTILYNFRATKNTDGTKTFLRISIRPQINLRSFPEDNIQTSDSYRAFYGWLDYALGLKTEWKTCAQLGQEAVDSGRTFDGQGVCTAQAIGGILPVDPNPAWMDLKR
jgi:hypothetical protein